MQLRDRILRETFGYTEFRPGQRQLVDAITAGRDVLGVLPTGAGKSLCYQLPSLLLPGVTLVLSPLISLMNDQVRALREKGISACCMHSGVSGREYYKATELISAGRCKLIYAAPERLESARFLQLIHSLPISLLVVDEAHCISQWGHDFRPSYRRIPNFINSLPQRPIIAAFTATATHKVRQDITDCLHLQSPERVVNSFDRPNLYFDVIQTADKDSTLLHLIRNKNRFPGIVYCATRKAAESTAHFLSDNGIPALPYHAGLRTELRQQAQNAFLTDQVPVLCATNAFGMGIDKPNVRFVIHYQLPGSLENYYQEAGRAGRDGQPSNCQLLFSESDVSLQEFLIKRDPENPALTDEEVRSLQQEGLRKLRAMKRFALSESCLRAEILKYFGEHTSDFCGNCGNCNAASELVDVTVDAQKLLSCVYRAHECASAAQICDILRGRLTDEIVFHGWATISTFGIMKKVSDAHISTLIAHLIRHDYLISVESKDGTALHLCSNAKKVLFRGEKVFLRVASDGDQNIREKRAINHSSDPQLYAELLELRKSFANRKGMPPSSVLTDQAVEQICQKRPSSSVQLHKIKGGAFSLVKNLDKKILNLLGKYEG